MSTIMERLAGLYEVIDLARKLGTRQLTDGTELIGHVPDVGPDAWLHVLFRGLSKSEIDSVRDQAGIELHSDFAEFLSVHNGLLLFVSELYVYGYRVRNPRVGDAARQPFGITSANRFERPKDAKGDELFIGGYGEDGSKLYADTTGVVHHCSPTSVHPLRSWQDVFEMLNGESRRLSTSFDERGRRIVRAGADSRT